MKILVIDDEPMLLECLEKSLHILGHEPIAASGVMEGFPLIPYADPVITDGLGGAVDGAWRTVVDRCQALGRPVVVYSGDDEVREETGSMGIPSVGKPGSIEAILGAIEGFHFDAKASAR